MVDVFEDTLNIGAGCPSDVAVNTNTRFQGTVDYHLVNRGDEDGFISILVTLTDSAGNNTQFSSSLQQPLAAPARALGAQVKHTSLVADTDLAALRVGPGTEPGSWGLAILTVLPVTGYYVVDLGRAPWDVCHRGAQILTVTTPGGKSLRVVNTHLTHRYISLVQLR